MNIKLKTNHIDRALELTCTNEITKLRKFYAELYHSGLDFLYIRQLQNHIKSLIEMPKDNPIVMKG